MASEFEIFENRRYSGLVIEHPSVVDYASFRSLLGRSAGKSTAIELPGSNWSVRRFQYIIDRSFYPDVVSEEYSMVHQRGVAHEMYFASTRSAGRAGVAVSLVASPYVRLLSHLWSLVKPSLPPPAPLYMKTDVELVRDALSARTTDDLTIVKATFQIFGDTAAQTIALSGRAPLRSNVFGKIAADLVPVSLRVKFLEPFGEGRVEFDKFGNLWWFQASESRLRGALDFVDFLFEHRFASLDRAFPLDRKIVD